jgi:hypothetical protein
LAGLLVVKDLRAGGLAGNGVLPDGVRFLEPSGRPNFLATLWGGATFFAAAFVTGFFTAAFFTAGGRPTGLFAAGLATAFFPTAFFTAGVFAAAVFVAGFFATAFFGVALRAAGLAAGRVALRAAAPRVAVARRVGARVASGCAAGAASPMLSFLSVLMQSDSCNVAPGLFGAFRVVAADGRGCCRAERRFASDGSESLVLRA